MRKLSFLTITLLQITLISGCGGNSSGPGIPLTLGVVTTPVSLTVTDAPPPGMQVLFFQLSITSAALQPGNTSLLNTTNPVPFNVSELQTETAFLSTANVATGAYSSLSLTFSNPQVTIFNGTGATLGGCANNAFCQITPTTTPLKLTLASAPFPITVAANTPLAFKLDIHLNTIIQPDMTVNLAAPNGISIEELAPATAASPVAALGNLIGTVQSLGSNQFTLETGDGRTLNIGVNSSTTYSNFPDCLADSFSCLALAQTVKGELALQSGGTLLATSVSYQPSAGQQVVEGKVVGLATATYAGGETVIEMVFQKSLPPATAASVLGSHAEVLVPHSGVTFSVDSSSFNIPRGLSFATASDLMVGQEVQLVVTVPQAIAIDPFNISFVASSVMLETSQITGSIAAINQSALSFSIRTFPNFFPPPLPTVPPGPTAAPPVFGPASITVQTTTQTAFQNLTPDSMQGIFENGVASVEGWLFSTPSGVYPATLAASTVVGRPGPIPLY